MAKMPEQKDEPEKYDVENMEKLVLTKLMYFSSVSVGIVTGLVLGGLIFIATNYLVLKGGPVVGPHLALLGQFFIGYEVTFAGSIIGLIYGFVTGFIIGYVVSQLYNRIASIRHRRKR